jgi:hypothetical protein
MSKKLRVWFWNPNGTNDIEVINSKGSTVDVYPEGLYGINTGDQESMIIPLSQALEHIAVSPVSDGSDVIRFLKEHFKSVK